MVPNRATHHKYFAMVALLFRLILYVLVVIELRKGVRFFDSKTCLVEVALSFKRTHRFSLGTILDKRLETISPN